MITSERFATGLTVAEFLSQYRNVHWQQRFQEICESLELPEEEQRFFGSLAPLHWKVLVIGEDWCHDVLNHLPCLVRVGALANWEIRVLRRDENRDLMRFYQRDERQRMPVFSFMTDHCVEAARWIERTRAAEALVQAGRAKLPPPESPEFDAANRLFNKWMGQEYRKGYLYREFIRELRELLSPLIASAGGAQHAGH